MGIKEFAAKAETVLQGIGDLNTPIRGLQDPHFEKEIRQEAEADVNLQKIGSVKLKGAIEADVHLTKAGAPPLALDAFAGDPTEPDHAYASLVVSATAAAGLTVKERVSSGVTLNAGAEADARYTLAHHLRVSQDREALDALVDFVRDLKTPYTASDVKSLGEDEVLQVEFEGSGVFRASGGWGYAFARTLDGENLEKLGVGELGGLEAGVLAGLTFKASLEGDLSVIAERSDQRDGWIRVKLEKRTASFVGAGLQLSAGVNLTQPDRFVESVLDRLLELPEGLVDRVGELEAELADIRRKIDELGGEALERIAEAAGTARDSLALDDLSGLVADVDNQPDALRSILGPLADGVGRADGLIEDAREDLEEYVDKGLAFVAEPLADASEMVGGWIAAYNDLRAKAQESMQRHVEQGIRAEFEASINRTRVGEALLDVDFDPDLAMDECLKALRGNFSPALESAATPGAEGVEIRGGTLKETTRTDRHMGLKLNLFGFKSRVDFQSWDEVTIKDDLKDGAIYVVGQGGASFAGEREARRAQEMSFVFDLYGAAERRDGAVYLEPDAGFRATLIRSATIEHKKLFRKVLPKHIGGAQRLGLIGAAEAADLSARLMEGDGSYGYELRLGFPATCIDRVFLLDRTDLRPKDVEKLLWLQFRQALDILDMEIPHGRTSVPMSELVTDDAIAEVRFQPTPDRWRRIRFLRVGGQSLQGGALRMIWAYLANAHEFVGSYKRARKALLDGKPVKRVTRTLRKMASEVVDTPGMFSRRPLDAKYLILALIEGLHETEVRMTFSRGDLEVTL